MTCDPGVSGKRAAVPNSWPDRPGFHSGCPCCARVPNMQDHVPAETEMKHPYQRNDVIGLAG